MAAPSVVGIDLSLTSTGLADTNGYTRRVQTKAVTGVPATVQRLQAIVDEVYLFALGNDLAVIEGPSYGSASTGQHTRGGLWWMVAARLDELRAPILVVPPTVRAKYAAGKGNAGKDAVLAAAIKRYPAFDISGNDIADAVVLAAIGARMLGQPIDDPMPATHLAALGKLALPADRRLG